MKKNFIKKAATALLLVSTLALSACGKKSAGPVKIGVPDDGTNQSRAIKLLETAGLIEVDPAAGYTPELKDVTKYIYNMFLQQPIRLHLHSGITVQAQSTVLMQFLTDLFLPRMRS